MIHRRLAFLVAVLSMAHAREGRATECGSSPELAAEKVHISTDPAVDCITASVWGTNRPGCEDLSIDVQNDCAYPIKVGFKDSPTCPLAQIDGFDPNDGYEGAWHIDISPGTAATLPFPGVEAGQVSCRYPITLPQQTSTLSVSADIVDISGCSIGAVDMNNASRMWMWLAGLGLAVSLLRVRRHQRPTRTISG